MQSLRLTICNAIVAKLRTVAGVETRWFTDGAAENTISETPLCVFYHGPDQIVGFTNRTIEREITGQVIFETTDPDAVMDDDSRDELDTVQTDVEQALIELGNTLNEQVNGVKEFTVQGYTPSFSGEDGGRIGSGFAWTCTYRHDNPNPRTFTSTS